MFFKKIDNKKFACHIDSEPAFIGSWKACMKYLTRTGSSVEDVTITLIEEYV